MAEKEEEVLFRVTRPNTTVFHPDRAVSLLPVQTGGEIKLPKSIADYHVKNGVGILVDSDAEPDEETQETTAEPKKAEDPKTPARRPGRPAKAAE